MSSVIVCSQIWMPELSVEFFNVNCRWQLAVGRRPPSGRSLLTTRCCVQSPFYGKCFCDLERTSCFNNSSTFQAKIEILRLFWKKILALEVFFWLGGTLLLTLTTTRPSLNTRIEILMFLKKMFFLTLRTYKQASKHFILETKCKGLSFIIVDCARSFRNTCF